MGVSVRAAERHLERNGDHLATDMIDTIRLWAHPISRSSRRSSGGPPVVGETTGRVGGEPGPAPKGTMGTMPLDERAPLADGAVLRPRAAAGVGAANPGVRPCQDVSGAAETGRRDIVAVRREAQRSDLPP